MTYREVTAVSNGKMLLVRGKQPAGAHNCSEMGCAAADHVLVRIHLTVTQAAALEGELEEVPNAS